MSEYNYIHEQTFAWPRGGIRQIDPRKKKDNIRDIASYMLDRTMQMFEWENLPETIPPYMLETYLQRIGYCVIAPHQNELYAFFGGFGGKPDEYYRPSTFIVTNPYLNFNKELKIDEDCILCKNDHNMMGLMPLINRYSSLLAENELSMFLTDVMSRLISIITTGNDNDAKAAKKYLEDIEKGDLGSLISKNFFQQLQVQPYFGSSGTNLLGQEIEYHQYLKASLFNEIGLDANYNMKRESLSMTESQMNDDALFPLVDDMEECRQNIADHLNEFYSEMCPGKVSVHKKSSWKISEMEQEAIEENIENVSEDTENDENVEVKEDETD